MNPEPAPQYYPNNIQPVEVTRENLLQALKELRVATRRGAELVEQFNLPDPEGELGLFMGVPGAALAFQRLHHQVLSLREKHDANPPNYQKLANERITKLGRNLPLLPGRLSPLGSSGPLAMIMLRIQQAAVLGTSVSDADVHCLREAVTIALSYEHIVSESNHNVGGDGILYGRAGLLWSILNVRVLPLDEASTNALRPIFEAVPQLIRAIIDAGRQGVQDYTRKYGSVDALPLMWTWMESHYGLGAVHGMSGILAVLLACNPEELSADDNYLSWIAGTIVGLCRLCIANQGYLPTSLPSYGSNSQRDTSLVQICHGSPAILLLLACARRNSFFVSKFWQPEWDQAVFLAAEKVWQERLVSKGDGICHGIAGNAWPLLILHDSCEYDVDLLQAARGNPPAREPEPKLTGDYFLSRALALLLHAREAPPYNPSRELSPCCYRASDRPYSLSEGLAGTVCAWAEACVTIQARLRKMDLEEENASSTVVLKNDELFQALDSRNLGLPTLAYYRPPGIL